MNICLPFFLRLQYRNVEVEIDTLLLPELKTLDKTSTNRIISFNLFSLIIQIGTIQSRRFNPSNRMKFMDKADLIEKIYTNTLDFRVKIDEIRRVNGSETITSISEDFGIGISVIIAENLFNIKSSTIQKIYGTGRRPDWKCQTIDNKIIVVEGKGSINQSTSNNQLIDALEQKTKEPGDIKIASLTVIKENTISTNRFLDPPVESTNNSPIMENHILRAGHYASIFSFLGNSKLSLYYSQMKKRLEGLITPLEQDLKDANFLTLQYSTPRINFDNKSFVGSFYHVQDDQYLYVGVNENLLSYSGFINFIDYENDLQEYTNGNMYILSKDGILIIEISNISFFNNIVSADNIPSYQDNITISDIDEMNEISFTKYFIYVLRKNRFSNIQQENLNNNLAVDLTATFNETTYIFEFKILKRKKISTTTIEQINFLKMRFQNEKLVLVTNATINNIEEDNLIIIDRKKLQKLSKNINSLPELLNIKPN